jgi:dienelactone hydrolase
VTSDSRLTNVVDPTREAVAGWSMGGGGTLDAAVNTSTLKAAIPIAPWETKSDTYYAGDRVPTLVVAGEGDVVAPENSMASPFYEKISAEKAYLEISGGNHFFTTSANTNEAKYMISWLKRFVDNDTRFEQFLCPGPTFTLGVSEYRSTCPLS